MKVCEDISMLSLLSRKGPDYSCFEITDHKHLDPCLLLATQLLRSGSWTWALFMTNTLVRHVVRHVTI